MKIVLRTHKARFFFANEITYNMGVPLKTISRMLGRKSVRTTEIYVRENRKNISENMEMVEKKSRKNFCFYGSDYWWNTIDNSQRVLGKW